ncbi:hypothetical protein KC853_01555 [Candidatus Saccharibacteria bacterium]|nr:hypothetical protein [Candidatus Saccharibacteria bacterium]MCB9834966.1 hypothetical protein [Candidatus Nomurabacteria bacterium]
MRKSYQIAVIGSVAEDDKSASLRQAEIVGQEIAKIGGVLLTGIGEGVLSAVLKGFRDHGGQVAMGFSPMDSYKTHLEKFGDEVDKYDAVCFNSGGYFVRSLPLIFSADAVIAISGRIGTLEEIAIAVGHHKPLGILSGSKGIIDHVEAIIDHAGYDSTNNIYDSDPVDLVQRVVGKIN